MNGDITAVESALIHPEKTQELDRSWQSMATVWAISIRRGTNLSAGIIFAENG